MSVEKKILLAYVAGIILIILIAFIAMSEAAAQPLPDIEIPDDVTMEATEAGGAILEYTTSDTLECDVPAGTLTPLGTTEVVCTVTASFTVEVEDTISPVISPPDTAFDTVDGLIQTTCDTDAAGITTCTATDAAGNTSTATFNGAAIAPPPPTGEDVLIAWDAPKTGEVEGYYLDVMNEGENNMTVITIPDPRATGYAVQGLTTGDYTMTIRAFNPEGEIGEPSDELRFNHYY